MKSQIYIHTIIHNIQQSIYKIHRCATDNNSTDTTTQLAHRAEIFKADVLQSTDSIRPETVYQWATTVWNSTKQSNSQNVTYYRVAASRSWQVISHNILTTLNVRIWCYLRWFFFSCAVSEMTYTVSSETLNSTIPYHTIPSLAVIPVGWQVTVGRVVATAGSHLSCFQRLARCLERAHFLWTTRSRQVYNTIWLWWSTDHSIGKG